MINVLDMETFQKGNSVIPYCICMILENKQYYFYYPEKLIINVLNSITNECKEKYIDIYVHNLNFDGVLIVDCLAQNFIKFDITAEKTNIYAIRITYCGKIISFKCSYKIIPIALKKLGDVENFPKKVFPYKFINDKTVLYKGKVPDRNYWEDDHYEKYMIENKGLIFDVKKESIEYCMNDVVLTQKILINLFFIIDQEDSSVRKNCLSSPSISHKLFYKKYNNFSIEESLKTEEAAYIRPSYFGGRCEVFGNINKGEHIKYFDFSGMYAQCMLENFHFGNSDFSNASDFASPGFYNIDYVSNFDFLPVLPSHYNEKLIFSNGMKSGTFWFEEIKLFQSLGGKILKINNAIVYKKFAPVFSNFVKNFNTIKDKGGYYKFFGKLMINSLYGGMGLKHKETIQYITFSEEEFFNLYKKTTVVNFYQINSCYITIIFNDYKAKCFFKNESKTTLEKTKRNVSYASAISSKARIKLYKALVEVTEDGGRLLYCDTDSIFAAYSKDDNRQEAKTFKWIDFYDDGVFIAPKIYGIKNSREIIKIKGVNNKEINFTSLKKKFYNDESINFNNQINFRKDDFNLKQFYISKEICLAKYDKRIFINNKKSTIPIHHNLKNNFTF